MVFSFYIYHQNREVRDFFFISLAIFKIFEINWTNFYWFELAHHSKSKSNWISPGIKFILILKQCSIYTKLTIIIRHDASNINCIPINRVFLMDGQNSLTDFDKLRTSHFTHSVHKFNIFGGYKKSVIRYPVLGSARGGFFPVFWSVKCSPSQH